MNPYDSYQAFETSLNSQQINQLRRQAALIKSSYEKLTGKAYFGTEQPDTLQAMWNAPWVQLSHGTEPDPVFNFANQAALKLFEMDFSEITQLPSRYSAEPMHRDERANLLYKVNTQGYIDDYAGIRISKSGKRFKITNATVFNLIDDHNTSKGQAARFSEVRIIQNSQHDSTI